MIHSMLSYFYVVFYCILGISAYLCSVNVKDSVLDVCIKGSFALSIGSLVRHLSPHSNGLHIIRAVFIFFLCYYNISVAEFFVESYRYSPTHIITPTSNIIGSGHNVWHKLHVNLCQGYAPLIELPPTDTMILLRMYHAICRNIMAVKITTHNLTYHTLCRFRKLYGKDLATLIPVKPPPYCICRLCQCRQSSMQTHLLLSGIRHPGFLIRHIRNHFNSGLAQPLYHCIAQHRLRCFHALGDRTVCLTLLHTSRRHIYHMRTQAITQTLFGHSHMYRIYTVAAQAQVLPRAV